MDSCHVAYDCRYCANSELGDGSSISLLAQLWCKVLLLGLSAANAHDSCGVRLALNRVMRAASLLSTVWPLEFCS